MLEQEVAPKGATVAGRDGLLLVELLDAYHTHAERHYRTPDGKPTSELAEVKLVIRALRETYGQEPAKDFGPLKLKAVRQGWVIAKLSRKEVNRRTNIARRIFKWAAAEELVPAATFTALATLAGLQKGRTTARETEPITPVDDATVDATLPHLNRFVRAMIEVQRLTGCRPGEACALRQCGIDESGAVWFYWPRQHKTAHKDKTRVIAIGPKCQALLEEFFTDDPSDFLFSAALAVEEAHAARTTNRKTPRFPSHMERSAKKRTRRPKRPPAACYTYHSYGRAVARACDRAFPAPAPLGQRAGETAAAWKARLTPGEKEQLKQWQDARRWAPNQLRHTFATMVRKEHGLEAAQVLLGHSKADVTQIYAEKNQSLAAAVAAKVG
ncbi:hypothetical protein FTUN_6638 [Frigoriglobus tundricola]|uniref:Tyr recombinase domain-containing protein n=2 Tax=Frigoriglobus tundricola TaxID=2774151 RepID=A0A6M5Z0V2_9BACT|nr:hypothetical protein FTUN_6638 [Frigoriglobus tundricola]